MKNPPVSLLFSLVLGIFGCGGKSTVSDAPTSDAGIDGSAGLGGTGAVGGSAGTGGVGGIGNTGGIAGTGGTNDGGTAGVGGTGAGGLAGGAPGCAMTTKEPDCDACMAEACPTDCETCASNTDCVAFVQCALACTLGDESCMQDCVASHTDGVADGMPLVGPNGCLRNHCNSECIAVGASCDLSVGDTLCDDCVAGYCLNECTACAENGSCVELIECSESCDPDDQGCRLQCVAQHVDGASDANAFTGEGGCVEEYCSVQCKGSPAECSIRYGDSLCDSCISNRCLADCNACADNTACVDLVACSLACPEDDQGCLGNCGLQNPTGVLEANAFAGENGCVKQKCAAECGSEPVTCNVSTGNAACDSCIGSECGGACTSCSENPECLALVECYYACSGDLPCQVQCGAENPGGMQTAASLIGPSGCASSNCESWCP